MEHHVVIVQHDIIVDDEHMDLVQVQISELQSVELISIVQLNHQARQYVQVE